LLQLKVCMVRSKVLAAAAGLLLLLSVPALAEDPAASPEPVESVDNSNSPAVAAEPASEAQVDTDTDWWWDDDGVTVGYLPGIYGFGPCGPRFQFGAYGRWGSPWWSGAGTDGWFPAGQPVPSLYGSRWCGNNIGFRSGWNLWAIRVFAPLRLHRRGHRTTSRELALASTSRTKLNSMSEAAADVPDDNWTRVDEEHVTPTALPKRQGVQSLRAGAAARINTPPHRPQQQVTSHSARILRSARIAGPSLSGRVHLAATSPAPHGMVRSGGRGRS
jgi:hypothetical protein